MSWNEPYGEQVMESRERGGRPLPQQSGKPFGGRDLAQAIGDANTELDKLPSYATALRRHNSWLDEQPTLNLRFS